MAIFIILATQNNMKYLVLKVYFVSAYIMRWKSGRSNCIEASSKALNYLQTILRPYSAMPTQCLKADLMLDTKSLATSLQLFPVIWFYGTQNWQKKSLARGFLLHRNGEPQISCTDFFTLSKKSNNIYSFVIQGTPKTG